jgi:hypothetical protein
MNRSIPFVLAIVAILAACNATNANGPFTGTVKGSISSSLGGALVGVRVVVYPPVGDSSVLHTSSTGAWQLDNTPVGMGNVQIESLPPDCDSQRLIDYFIASPGTTASLTLTVHCTSSHQVVAGAGDFDAGAIDEVRRDRAAARRVRLEDRVAGLADAPRWMGHVIFDGRPVALARIAPMALRHERLL